ncbi:efflux RND transporter permease subunit [Escherichia coli]
MLTTIGLSAKNAILIVEFAKELYGTREVQALGEPRVMRLPVPDPDDSSSAFILGVLPLVISSGAGASSRNAIGTGVMGGMISGDRACHLLRAAVLRCSGTSLCPL